MPPKFKLNGKLIFNCIQILDVTIEVFNNEDTLRQWVYHIIIFHLLFLMIIQRSLNEKKTSHKANFFRKTMHTKFSATILHYIAHNIYIPQATTFLLFTKHLHTTNKATKHIKTHVS